jgi:Uma2 family endonuclease
MHVPLILRYLAAVIAPDIFVVRSAAKRDRPFYRLWQESKGSDFVLEIISKPTRRDDQETKPRMYAALRVQEYFQ